MTIMKVKGKPPIVRCFRVCYHGAAMTGASSARRALLFFIVVMITAPIYAEPFRMVSAGDPVLEDLRFLSREGGVSLLSLTPPLSGDEIRNALSGVDPDRLSASGREAYHRVLAALARKPAILDAPFGFSVRPELALEARARSTGDIPWSSPETSSASLLTAPFEFFFSDRLYARLDLSVRTDPTYYDRGDGAFGTNVPLGAGQLDMNIPFRSFLSAGGAWWNFQIGRDKVSFGTARTGNLAINDTPSFYDFARVSLFAKNFKYSLFVTQQPMDPSDLLAEGGTIPAGAPSSTTQRYLYYHRMDARFFDRLSIGVGEGAMVGNSPLELRFLNPLAIYHGYFSWLDYPKWPAEKTSDEGSYVGSLLSIDLDWSIHPGWALYGQFVMNEYTTEYEQDKWPDSARPNGLGYLAGIEHTRSLGPFAATFSLETVYADPYLYTLSSPFCSYISMRRLSALSKKDPLYSWIGHPQGRDFALFSLGADLRRGAKGERGAFGGEVGVTYTLQGEHGLRWDWSTGASADEVSPSGTVERRLAFKVSPWWSPLDSVTLGTSVALVQIENFRHVKGDEAIGVEGTLSFGWKY